MFILAAKLEYNTVHSTTSNFSVIYYFFYDLKMALWLDEMAFAGRIWPMGHSLQNRSRNKLVGWLKH